jgi:hypothetical protein
VEQPVEGMDRRRHHGRRLAEPPHDGARLPQGDLAHAALAASTRFVELDATAWSNNTVRVMARNISATATFDLGTATLSVAVTKRRIP